LNAASYTLPQATTEERSTFAGLIAYRKRTQEQQKKALGGYSIHSSSSLVIVL
jgi:hypothetical protein